MSRKICTAVYAEQAVPEEISSLQNALGELAATGSGTGSLCSHWGVLMSRLPALMQRCSEGVGGQSAPVWPFHPEAQLRFVGTCKRIPLQLPKAAMNIY